MNTLSNAVVACPKGDWDMAPPTTPFNKNFNNNLLFIDPEQ